MVARIVYARPFKREADAHRALEAGVRELVNGKWVIPAPDYVSYNAARAARTRHEPQALTLAGVLQRDFGADPYSDARGAVQL